MYGYKIKINSLPSIVWACETKVDDYEWENQNSKDMLEISVCRCKTAFVTCNNTEYILNKGSFLSCLAGDDKRSAFCETGMSIEIISVAVSFPESSFEKGEFAELDYLDNSVLLLPALLDGLSTEDNFEINTLLYKLIKNNVNSTAYNLCVFYSDLFKLLAKIDYIVRKSHYIPKDKLSNYYIRKTNAIIERSYAQKITLSFVAKELNISPVYLSAIYKKNTGITFSEFLLDTRMQHARQMLSDYNIPTSKIAAATGFSDESYFRKKFKQFFGVNVREFKNMKNITLYHDKPLRKK